MKTKIAPTFRGKLSVLLFESEQSVLETYVRAFKEIFAVAQYEVDMHSLASGGGSSTNDNAALFETTYFDILISDVSLGDISNNLGLRFLTMIKDRYPDIFTIAFTGHPVTYRGCSSNYRFDFFVDKQRIEVKKYQDFVAGELHRLLGINPFAYVANRASDYWPDISHAEHLDLNRIIRRITHTGPPDSERSHIASIRLRPIEGGFSGAKVLHMDARTGSGQSCLHTVLKVARVSDSDAAESIRREVENYRRLVRWHLPYQWRPELLGAASSGLLEALCYAFVSTREEPFETLRKFIRQGKFSVVSHSIESIFHPARSRWYDARNVRGEASLMSFYLEHCFGEGGSSEKQADMFRKTLRQYDISAQDIVRVRNLDVPVPSLALFARPAGGYQSCLIHGDLNTSNVFVSTSGEGSDIMLIDFASTRRGHVFYDFIVFEVNLRLDHREKDKVDVHRRILNEQLLNRQKPSDVPLAEEILRLREYATKNFPKERSETYLYGLAAFCFSLMIASNLSETDRMILAACIGSALLDLQARGFWADLSIESNGKLEQ